VTFQHQIRIIQCLIAMSANAFALTLTACSSGDTRSSGSSNRETRETAVPVGIVEAELGDMAAMVSFNATVESERTVRVYPQIAGLVDRLYAEEGDRVEAGQVLLRLEDDDARLAVRRAEIELDKARRDSTRQADLFSKDLISRNEYEQAVYLANRARVALEESALAYNRTHIRTPVAGIVSTRNVELGDRVTTAIPAYEVVTMTDLVAQVYVPGRHRPNLRVGQPAQITSDMIPGYRIDGRIRRISPVISPQSGTVKVTVELDDPERKLAPGMFANVGLVIDSQTDALLAPKEALVYDGGQAYAFVVRGERANRVRLELGLSNARQVQVLGGIGRGDSVVVVGHEGLRDGAMVRVIADPLTPIPPSTQPEPVHTETDTTIATTGS
jgi:membrane fusion protein, multidrug efflux system